MHIDTVNMEEVTAARSILQDRFVSLVETYIEDANNHIKEIEEGIAAQDEERISCAAHTLKSSSAGLGATSVSEIARTIELAVKLNHEPEVVPELINPLKKALRFAADILRIEAEKSE